MAQENLRSEIDNFLTLLVGELGTKLPQHPQSAVLLNILKGQTELSSSGYPFIAEDDFASFISAVPHLFENGGRLLEWLDPLWQFLQDGSSDDKDRDVRDSLKRSVRVLRNIVLTAAITSPSDLWLLRQIISTHKKTGAIGYLLSGAEINSADFSARKSYSKPLFDADLAFLHCRGYLKKVEGKYRISSDGFAKRVLTNLQILDDLTLRRNWYEIFRKIFARDFSADSSADKYTEEEGDNISQDGAERLAEAMLDFSETTENHLGWQASVADIELGFRVVPVVLALRNLEKLSGYKSGDLFAEGDRSFSWSDPVAALFRRASYLDSDNRVTQLGVRVFSRGSGPFGIIYTYHSYLMHHEKILNGDSASSWVSRGENVAASQDANKKTFEMANDALDRFVESYDFSYDVYIEHAVGHGEATRQRLERSGEEGIRYFGADLEDAAIERAVSFQEKGDLPKNMQFIRNADIGQPSVLIDGIRNLGTKTERAVMIVGNGFHEVRGQTNENMIQVFSEYCQAGIVLLFTEESGLMDEDLLSTAWNTYHAGFRYVHNISGQGLRPSLDRDNPEADGGNLQMSQHYSWKKCASLGGYEVLADYSTRTRTIYPHPRRDGYNPAISVNYFCVPRGMMRGFFQTARNRV